VGKRRARKRRMGKSSRGLESKGRIKVGLVGGDLIPVWSF